MTAEHFIRIPAEESKRFLGWILLYVLLTRLKTYHFKSEKELVSSAIPAEQLNVVIDIFLRRVSENFTNQKPRSDNRGQRNKWTDTPITNVIDSSFLFVHPQTRDDSCTQKNLMKRKRNRE